MKKYLVMFFLLTLIACSSADPASTPDETIDRLQVVATTTIVGDVVRAVAGGRVDLDVLLPPGADPHSFDPSPNEARTLADADLVFVNGLGLDTALEALVPEGGDAPKVVVVSAGVDLIALAPAEADQSGDADTDPHVWMDPNNVIIWVGNIADALADADPAGAAEYDSNAAGYIHQLIELDVRIAAQVESIPVDGRQLVTDHDSMGYFSRRYGFEIIGFVVPGTSTLAQPSAQGLAELIDMIKAFGVPAIFVEPTFNPGLAESVAADAGVAIVPLYTGFLTGPDGPAPTYLDLLRFDIDAITAALADQ